MSITHALQVRHMPHEKHTSRPYIVTWTQAAVVAALLTPLTAAQAAPRSAKLAWKPSQDADVAGYRVHYGTNHGKHDKVIDAAKATSVSVPDLSDDSTYYFVVTAYNSAGLESEPSKEMFVGAKATATVPTSTQATSADATDSKVTESNATATTTSSAVPTPTTAVSTPASVTVTTPATTNSKPTATSTAPSTTEPTTATSAPATATVTAPATTDSKSVATTTAPSTTASAAKKARNGKLAWKPSKDADVAGYRVHYGNTRGKHDKTIDAGTATSASIPNLSNGNAYYAVVTAYNHAGLESKPSDEISVEANATASAPATQATSADTTAPATSDAKSATATAPSTAAATSTTTAPSATASAAYTAWSAQIPSEKDRAATADADGDGLSNLLEYALGRSAATAEDAAPLKLTRDGNKLTVSYSRPVDRTDVRYELQVSHDLNSWVTVPDTQRTTASGSGERVYERNIAGIGRLFFRLNVNGAGASASTTPAGVINTNIAGGNGSSPAAGTSVIGVGLTQFAAYRGTAETVDKNTLGDAQAKWTEGQFEGSNGAYLLEITSGPAAGTTYDIAKTSAQSLTLSQPLASGITSGVTFEIRKQWTLGSIFGTKNEAGLGGGSSTTADLVQVRNGEQYDTYYYQTTGEGGIGWRKQGDPSTDQANVVVYQEDGITIKRKQAQPTKLSFVGAVKQGKTSIPVFPGQNVLANVYSAPLTLAGSGLYTGNPATGLASGSETTADQVLMWNGAKYDTYYYSTQGGWKKVGAANDAGKTQIPVGGAITIVRKAAEGFNWVASQPSSKDKAE
ncbi:TIGR02597 family protein [Verrucomicrobiota bacterium sgz303538]